jgi:hypothetical protein
MTWQKALKAGSRFSRRTVAGSPSALSFVALPGRAAVV